MNNKSPSLFTIVASVCAALLGVQSENNRQRDFAQGNVYHYIIAGVIITILFVTCLLAIVSWVLD